MDIGVEFGDYVYCWFMMWRVVHVLIHFIFAHFEVLGYFEHVIVNCLRTNVWKERASLKKEDEVKPNKMMQVMSYCAKYNHFSYLRFDFGIL